MLFRSGAKVIKKDAVAKTGFDVIINATPIGMAGNKAPQLLEAKDLNTKLVFDLVYNPLETPLLRMARQQNIPIITGIEMFVQQGVRQFEIFTGGKPAPEEEMLRVVIHALKQAAEAAAAEQPAAPAPKAPVAPKPAAKATPAPKAATPKAKAPAPKAAAPKAKAKKAS